MDRNLALDFVFVAEDAAVAAAAWRGRGDKTAADQAATTAMRNALGRLNIRGTVRIGEGEMDEAPMLYIGEQVGRWAEGDMAVDIAVDPLEGTKLCAQNGPGAITAIAFAEDGGFLNAPDMYMEKIAVGPKAKGAIDITKGVAWNLSATAEAKGKRVSDLTVFLLDRDRHAGHVAEIRKTGARVLFRTDGDLMGAIATAFSAEDIDILFGSGGAPEGVLAAAALRCLGGDMQGILLPENDEQTARAVEMTRRHPAYAYRIDELAGGNVMFAATGVTNGPVMRGVQFHEDGRIETESLVTRSLTGSTRIIRKSIPSL